LVANSPRVPVLENPADPGVPTADSVLRTVELAYGTTFAYGAGAQQATVLNTGLPATMGGTSYNFVAGVGGNGFSAISSYAGNRNGGWNQSNGAFRGDLRPVRFSQVSDGLSNTVMVGPRPFSGNQVAGAPPGTGYYGFWALSGFAYWQTVGQYALPLNLP